MPLFTRWITGWGPRSGELRTNEIGQKFSSAGQEISQRELHRGKKACACGETTPPTLDEDEEGRKEKSVCALTPFRCSTPQAVKLGVLMNWTQPLFSPSNYSEKSCVKYISLPFGSSANPSRSIKFSVPRCRLSAYPGWMDWCACQSPRGLVDASTV